MSERLRLSRSFAETVECMGTVGIDAESKLSFTNRTMHMWHMWHVWHVWHRGIVASWHFAPRNSASRHFAPRNSAISRSEMPQTASLKSRVRTFLGEEIRFECWSASFVRELSVSLAELRRNVIASNLNENARALASSKLRGHAQSSHGSHWSMRHDIQLNILTNGQ